MSNVENQPDSASTLRARSIISSYNHIEIGCRARACNSLHASLRVTLPAHPGSVAKQNTVWVQSVTSRLCSGSIVLSRDVQEDFGVDHRISEQVKMLNQAGTETLLES